MTVQERILSTDAYMIVSGRRYGRKEAMGDKRSRSERSSRDGLETGSHRDGASRRRQSDDNGQQASFPPIFSLLSLIAMIAIIVMVLWPYMHMLFEEDGLEKTIEHMDNAGIQGVLLLEALQFLQIVVAFIPGEVVQFTAGAIYGPWWGALIIFVGCVISSAFIFLIVHKLGAPFVKDMVPAKYLEKFEEFEKKRMFNVIVFVLFLIPGLPKDVFTYITPLSDMPFRTFIVITNIARIPGIVLSTYAANGLIEGDIWQSVLLFAVLAIVSVVALVVFNKIMQKRRH